MSAQNVYGALGEIQRDPILGHSLGYASSRGGYGASYPLPVELTSFSGDEQADGSDLMISRYATASGIESQLMYVLSEYATAAEQGSESEQFVQKMGQFLEALYIMRADNHAFTGSNDQELGAVVEVMSEANPDASAEELVNLVNEMMDFIDSWQDQTVYA